MPAHESNSAGCLFKVTFAVPYAEMPSRRRKRKASVLCALLSSKGSATRVRGEVDESVAFNLKLLSFILLKSFFLNFLSHKKLQKGPAQGKTVHLFFVHKSQGHSSVEKALPLKLTC